MSTVLSPRRRGRASRSTAAWCTLWCAALVPFASRAEAPRAQRVAVYDLETNSVPVQLGRVLTDAIVEEIRKLDAVAVVGMSEIRAMLNHEAEKQLAGCSQDSCVAEIAEALGVDVLVIGSVSTVGSDRVLLLKSIEQRAASTAGTFSVRAAVDDDETLLASVGKAVETLFPDRPLRRGATRGISDRLARRLHPPPVAPAAWFTMLGASGAFVAGSIGLTIPALLSASAFQAYKDDPSHQQAYDLKQHDALGAEAQTWMIASVSAWAVTGVALATTLTLLPLTDWNREGVTPETAQAAGAQP